MAPAARTSPAWASPSPPSLAVSVRPTAARVAVAPLHSPAFRRYLVGQLPSVTCSWAQVVALSWVVVQIDPRALGWVVALQFLPSLVLGPWFGAVVDRHDRRLLLILAEVGLGLVAVGYTATAAAGTLSLAVDLPVGLGLGRDQRAGHPGAASAGSDAGSA